MVLFWLINSTIHVHMMLWNFVCVPIFTTGRPVVFLFCVCLLYARKVCLFIVCMFALLLSVHCLCVGCVNMLHFNIVVSNENSLFNYFGKF